VRIVVVVAAAADDDPQRVQVGFDVVQLLFACDDGWDLNAVPRMLSTTMDLRIGGKCKIRTHSYRYGAVAATETVAVTISSKE
jgi:hypothetical protein